MIIENLIQDPVKIDELRRALSILYNINMFGALLEIGMNQGDHYSSDDVVAQNALKSAWKDGYWAALNNLYYFQEKFVQRNTGKPRIDFGATEDLLKNAEITEDEYAELTGKFATNKR